MKTRTKRKIIVKIRRNLKWIILLCCMILFFMIVEDILDHQIWEFDDNVYEFVSKMISDPVTSIFKIVTNLGGAIGILSATLLVTLIPKEKKYGFYTLLNLAIITIGNQVLKFVIQRPRPIEHRIIDQNGYSFPSGHSMVSMAFYGFLIYLIYHNVENSYIKWSLCTLLTILIFVIGISRIYLGVHYASDVIGGFCLSLSYLIIYTKMIGKNVKTKIN